MLDESTLITPSQRRGRNKYYFNDRTKEAKQLEFDRYRSFMRIKTPNVSVHDIQLMFSDVTIPEYLYEYLPEFNVEHYQTDFRDVNYSLCVINGYVNYITDGVIEHVVQPRDFFNTQLLLISTTDFQGKWKVN